MPVDFWNTEDRKTRFAEGGRGIDMECGGSTPPWMPQACLGLLRAWLAAKPAKRARDCGPGWSVFCGTLGKSRKQGSPRSGRQTRVSARLSFARFAGSLFPHRFPRVPQNTLHPGPHSCARFAGWKCRNSSARALPAPAEASFGHPRRRQAAALHIGQGKVRACRLRGRQARVRRLGVVLLLNSVYAASRRNTNE